MDTRDYPTAGDAVRLTGVWEWAGSLLKVGDVGIINGRVGDRIEHGLEITWKFSQFRGYGSYGCATLKDSIKRPKWIEKYDEALEFVSCSGGPGTIALPPELLVPSFLPDGNREYMFVWAWCWKDLPKANGGVSYHSHVPVWLWDGKEYPPFSPFYDGKTTEEQRDSGEFPFHRS